MNWLLKLLGIPEAALQDDPVAPAASATPNITIKDKPDDVPEFRRTYIKTLDSRAVIEVDIRERYGSFTGTWLSKSGTLTQPDRRYVWFDPERIADKIIDPLLVPLVEQAVREIFAIDDAWRASKPRTFKDERGTVWTRA